MNEVKLLVDPNLEEPPKSFKRRKNTNPELVHGLTETVELKDWEFAIILAALKFYAKNHEKKATSTYAQNLAKKLRVPFSQLVIRTKRKHKEILASMNTDKITDFTKKETT